MSRKVFITGSRSIKRFTDDITNVLKSIRDNNDSVLIGDAAGIDELAQKYFKLFRYNNVAVYCANGKPRHNVGDFPVVNIETMARGREYYGKKDIAMADECDYAIAIWDGYSRGTKENIDRVKELGKPVTVIICGKSALI